MTNFHDMWKNLPPDLKVRHVEKIIEETEDPKPDYEPLKPEEPSGSYLSNDPDTEEK